MSSPEYQAIHRHVSAVLEGVPERDALFVCVSTLDELMTWASHLLSLTLAAADGEITLPGGEAP